MDLGRGCWVCRAQDLWGRENFSFGLNGNGVCVGCLVSFWKDLRSNPVVVEKSCTVHNRAFDLFCMNCQILLCGKCIMSHREHEIEDIDEMYSHVSGLKSRIWDKREGFLRNLEKTKVFSKEFKGFLGKFGDKNEVSLATSCFFNDNKERYEQLLNKRISLELHKREEKVSESKRVAWRSRRIGEGYISDLRGKEAAKTEVVVLRELFSSASLIQKISIFLFVKNKKGLA